MYYIRMYIHTYMHIYFRSIYSRAFVCMQLVRSLLDLYHRFTV